MDSEESNKCKRSTDCSSVVTDVCTGETSALLTTFSNEKRLKKDDSGITVDAEEEPEIASSSVEKQTTNELSSPDSGNVESDNLNESVNITKISTSLDFGALMDKEIEVEMDKDDSLDESDHSDSKEVREKKNYDPTPNVPRPKCNWVAPKAIVYRQYGNSVNYSPNSFRYDCYGSLQMVERLELMYKMKQHEGCVNSLHFNSTGTKLVSGSDDLTVIIWDWTISDAIADYQSGHRSNVFQAKFLPLTGDTHIVSCARDGQIRIAELSSSGECRSSRKIAQHKSAAHKLAVQYDVPHTFLSCGEDAAVFELDLREEKPEKLLICKEDNKKVPLYSIFINPYKPYEFTIGGRDHFVRVYDKRCIRQDDGILKKFCPEHLASGDSKATVTSVLYNYNGEEILASYNDEDIYLFDSNACDTSQFLHRYRGHRNSQTVKGVNFFGSKSEYIVSGSDCGYVFFWDKATEHIVKYMHGDEGGVVNCLEANPNMPVLATSGLDSDIKIWVPSCEHPPDLSGLKEHVTKNMKEREEESKYENAIDDRMMWLLMQHIRRIRRRSQMSGMQTTASSSSSSSDYDSHDEEEFHHASVECNQS